MDQSLGLRVTERCERELCCAMGGDVVENVRYCVL